jgi:WD40 repeat protein
LLSGDGSGQLSCQAPGRPERVWHAHDGPILVTQTDGTIIASAAADGRLRIWRYEDAALLHTIIPNHRGHPLRLAALAPQRRWIAAPSSAHGATIGIWSVLQGERIAHLRGRHPVVTALCFSPNERLLCAGRADGGIDFFDTQSGELLPEQIQVGGAATTVRFAPDGHLLLVASEADGIALWQVVALRVRHRLSQNTIPRGICFDRTGNTVVALLGNTLHFWSVQTGALVSAFALSNPPVAISMVSTTGQIALVERRGQIEQRQLGPEFFRRPSWIQKLRIRR